MTLQTEPGKSYPMRPVTATLEIASEFTTVVDTTPVTWTATNLRLTPAITQKFMDDQDVKITIGSGQLLLEPGLWRVDMNLHLINTTGAAGEASVALTNLAGSVVHYANEAITVAPSSDIGYSCSALVDIPSSATGVGVSFRVASSATTIRVSAGHIGTVTKIGNHGEAGPA